MTELHRKYADVIYNSNHEGVVIIWKDYTTDEQFQEVYEGALSVASEYICKCWIEEMGQGKTVPSLSVEWVNTEFFARLANTSVRKVAFLVERNSMRNLYAEAVLESIRMTGLQVKCFNTRIEMEKWIKEGAVSLSNFTNTFDSGFNQYY
jgi:hypothetical protein